MALISGKYYRGDLNIKPIQWGTISQVRNVVRTRIEDTYGIPWKNVPLVLPLWGSGNQINYGYAGSFSNNGAIYDKNQLFFNSTQSQYLKGPALIDSLDFTIFSNCDFIANSNVNTIIDIAGSSTAYLNWYIRTDPLNQVILYARGHIGNPNIITAAVTDNNYHKVIARHESNVLTELFVDSLYGTSTSTTTTTTSFHSNTDQSGVGAIMDLTPGYFADGHIDYVIKIDLALPNNSVSKINDNPYSLIQPPTFRTYFIPDDVALYNPKNRIFTGPFSGPFTGAL